ncbi:MAG: serine/threonine protein kinase [Deltaproteobacteria bacterium]|nr:serine/threonine protein kinase [Deltaproteobacteria bacterium]
MGNLPTDRPSEELEVEPILATESVEIEVELTEAKPSPQRTGPLSHAPTVTPEPPGRPATTAVGRRTPSTPKHSAPLMPTPSEAARNARAHTPTGDGAAADDGTDDRIGRVLGSYRVLDLIGSGGMGRVYLAEHVMLGRKVALKLLRPEYAVKTDAVHRFFQEARAVNRIGHANIVDITDFVSLATGETFFIMELLRGNDLAELLRNRGVLLPLERALQITLQVCDGLEAAHQAGVIHRDLKPDNVFLLDQPKGGKFVKLLDFGVAKLQADPETHNSWETAAGSVIGTPAYMSPEQASGLTADNRSDIYSLGAILYEMFAGQPVFKKKTFGEFVVAHMNDIPKPPRDLPNGARVPRPLERIILRCLEKSPDRRYQSVDELRADLLRMPETISAVRRLGDSSVVVAQPPPPVSKSRRPLLIALGGFGLFALAATAFFVAAGIDWGGEKGPSRQGAPVARSVDAQAAAPRVATVTLRSVPSGADVSRPGEPRSLGTTPLKVAVDIGARVTFVFTLKGFSATTRTLNVVGDQTATIEFERAEPTPSGVAMQPRPVADAAVPRRRRGTASSASKRRRGSSAKQSDPVRAEVTRPDAAVIRNYRGKKSVPSKRETIDPFKIH